jgi:hypothetical protein
MRLQLLDQRCFLLRLTTHHCCCCDLLCEFGKDLCSELKQLLEHGGAGGKKTFWFARMPLHKGACS